MNRDLLTGLAIGLIAGCLIGYFVGNAHLFESDIATAPAVAKGPAAGPGGVLPGALGQLDAQQRLVASEAAVAAEPKNVQAWIALGNDAFDLSQPQKSVDAYSKALTLDPNLPNAADILTDRGVMYRALKDFPKAIADFKQAGKLNPKHTQSLYNLGIVYAQDQNQPALAKQAWDKIIALDPGTPAAEQARQAIAALTAAKHP